MMNSITQVLMIIIAFCVMVTGVFGGEPGVISNGLVEIRVDAEKGTVSYAVSGRLLLTESFHRFTDEVLSDLSRIYPFHATTLSARPLDAFIRSLASVFDFPISADWHQVVLYNGPKDDRESQIPISGDTAFGAMGLDAGRQYYVYDFWNDRFVGKVSGDVSIPGATGQLFNLSKDPGETTNLFFKESDKRKELQQLLRNLKTSGRSAPKARKPIGIENIPVINRKIRDQL